MKRANHAGRANAPGARWQLALAAACLLSLAAPAGAQDAGKDENELAKQLSNPVANLISVPLQFNYDDGYGNGGGDRWTLNIQPVIPVSISDSWNLISRTILPMITQNFDGPGNKKTGLGDTSESLFFSPKDPTKSGWIWGAGPILSIPTGGEAFSAHQWGAGPTFVVLKQQNGWTYGMLANHVWSFAENTWSGGNDPPYVSSTFLQPFLAKIIAPGRTVTLNTESTYDWRSSQWTVPINLQISQVLKLDGHLISIALGGRGYATAPTGGPDWGARLVITLLYPK
jgi:hypothetical protein